MADEYVQAPWSGAVVAGVGVAAKVRIPIPGTHGLCIQLDAPGGYKGSTSTLFFVQDPANKNSMQLRLDYGERPTGVNGQKVIDYHWNQVKTHGIFEIKNHSTANAAGKYLYQFCKYFRYAGRVVMVVGIIGDTVSVVQADKPLKQASSVVAGWAGAVAGCKVAGAVGADIGFKIGTVEPGGGNAIGTAVGGFTGCIIGGIAGYWGASKTAEAVYDWADGTTFHPLMEESERNVYQWLHPQGF